MLLHLQNPPPVLAKTLFDVHTVVVHSLLVPVVGNPLLPHQLLSEVTTNLAWVLVIN